MNGPITTEETHHISDIRTICRDCARQLGFKPKDKVVGVWVGECEVCHQHKTCTDLWHDWEPIKKGESK